MAGLQSFPSDAPSACPGTDNELAGKASACEGCPNQRICATTPRGPDPDVEAIKDNLKTVRHKYFIMSGKGGVGKSTVAAQLALALSERLPTGIVDLDLCGPSIPRILGAPSSMPIHRSSAGWTPVYVSDSLAVVSMPFLLEDEDTAVIWRGDKKTGMIKHFLKDVDWEEAEVLLFDTPPGTSDEHIAITSLLPNASGAIVVTTPQEVALQDVRKIISFCRKVKLPLVGVIENMSGFVCPSCNRESTVFPQTTGGARALCEETGVEFLGAIPLDPRIGRASDEGGVSVLEAFPASAAAVALRSIVSELGCLPATP